MSTTQWDLIDSSLRTLSRPLGDSETAFFRTSNTGLGDMFLHLAFRAPGDIMLRERMKLAWSIIRISHPLLMSTVHVEANGGKAKFCFTPPADVQGALDEADRALFYRNLSREELISHYLNGPRTLSNDQLSYLVVSQCDPKMPEFQLFLCAPHFMGDATAVHQSTHDLLVILASLKSNTKLNQDLRDLLEYNSLRWSTLLPSAFESLLKPPVSPLARAIFKINFLQVHQREVGNHVFPRQQRAAKRTGFLEHIFSDDQTKVLLGKCKSHSVSINNVVFALCAAAWAKTSYGADVSDNTMPVMMYSAVNLRPFLPSTPSYWYLSISYFTISLPSYAPKSSATFWNRARLAKRQTSQAVKSPFLLARALAMASQRASTPDLRVIRPQLPPHARVEPVTPSRALLGLSLIGNLDAIFVREKYERLGVELIRATGAARQKEGGLLLLVHTFGGRLWLQLCWDEVGFSEGVIEQWWTNVVSGVEEYMM